MDILLFLSSFIKEVIYHDGVRGEIYVLVDVDSSPYPWERKCRKNVNNISNLHRLQK